MDIEISQVYKFSSDSACSYHKMHNGDSAYLKEGTMIYKIKGYPPLNCSYK